MMKLIEGQIRPCIPVRATARRKYSRFTRAKSRVSASSWAKAFTTRIPEKFSCAFVDMSPNCAWSRSKRTWTVRPMYQNVIEASGMRISARIVSFTDTESIESTAKANTMIVNEPCMMPGPIIWRTHVRSFVMRAMRSPIRWCWKYARCMRCRCAKRSFRMRYSAFREASSMT